MALPRRGFLPEGLLNYLALLGWSIGDDREIFTLDEMVEAFDVGRVNPNPARFDLKKCEAINGDSIRALSPDELAPGGCCRTCSEEGSSRQTRAGGLQTLHRRPRRWCRSA